MLKAFQEEWKLQKQNQSVSSWNRITKGNNINLKARDSVHEDYASVKRQRIRISDWKRLLE